MSGPTLIARVVPKASKAIMGKDRSKARISFARLVDHWPEIVAPEDPLLVRPVRVGWTRRGEGADKVSTGTLYIAAPSALATRLKFQEAIIVGRVNRLFGLSATSGVTKIAHSHDRVAPPQKAARRKGKGEIDGPTGDVLAGVEDPVLRARLEGLARAMDSRGK